MNEGGVSVCVWVCVWENQNWFHKVSALTDLFSWTFPAELNLSETLPAVSGLETPDETSKEHSVRQEGEEAIVC